jgi:hypothetical protein
MRRRRVVKKPSEGDVITLKDKVKSLGEETVSDFFKVIMVRDHYYMDRPGGNWDPFGECAMAQADHDTEVGETGEWYVICVPCERSGDEIEDDSSTVSFGSYEVKEK